MATVTTVGGERQSSGGIGCGGVIVLAVVVIVAMMVLMSGLPALEDDSHAAKKHGQDATAAWQYIESLPPVSKQFCKHNCADGRTRYVCPMKGPGDMWAIAVVEAGNLVTSFISDHDYAKHVIDNQCGDSKWAHP